MVVAFILINVYQPYIQTENIIFFTTDLQWDILKRLEQEDKDIRDQMVNNLIEFINNLRKRGHEIILPIDANKAFISGYDDITKIVQHTSLLDPISNKYGTILESNTYKRGNQRNNFASAPIPSKTISFCVIFTHLNSLRHPTIESYILTLTFYNTYKIHPNLSNPQYTHFFYNNSTSVSEYKNQWIKKLT